MTYRDKFRYSLCKMCVFGETNMCRYFDCKNCPNTHTICITVCVMGHFHKVKQRVPNLDIRVRKKEGEVYECSRKY